MQLAFLVGGRRRHAADQSRRGNPHGRTRHHAAVIVADGTDESPRQPLRVGASVKQGTGKNHQDDQSRQRSHGGSSMAIALRDSSQIGTHGEAARNRGDSRGQLPAPRKLVILVLTATTEREHSSCRIERKLRYQRIPHQGLCD